MNLFSLIRIHPTQAEKLTTSETLDLVKKHNNFIPITMNCEWALTQLWHSLFKFDSGAEGGWEDPAFYRSNEPPWKKETIVKADPGKKMSKLEKKQE